MQEVKANPGKVVVIGGGVAGLTAAHELQERGFEVIVYERNTALGGKARSFNVPNNYPKKDICGQPAEHGFRFFPGFYKHLSDTLSRIPAPSRPGADKASVADHLVEPEWAAFAQIGAPFYRFPTDRPETFEEMVGAIRVWLSNPALGVPVFEAAFAASQLVNAMTMCVERREKELDGLTWWEYMRADEMSPQYNAVIVDGLTQNFVAMDAKRSSTKSVINILARLFNDFVQTNLPMDRILDGPTSEVWIDPWERYLEAKRPGQTPVEFKKGRAVHSFSFEENTGLINGIRLRKRGATGSEDDDWRPNSRGGELIETDAHYFVAAVPIESMWRLLFHSPKTISLYAPSLAYLDSDLLKTNWMSGIIYYLKKDLISDSASEKVGHIVLVDSPCALTAISQKNFWAQKGNVGNVGGILSVILSDWGKYVPRIEKAAWQSDNPDELAKEVLEQIRERAGANLKALLGPENVIGFYVDPALKYRRAKVEDERGETEEVDLMCGEPLSARDAAVRKARVRRSRSDRPMQDTQDVVTDENEDEYIERNIEPLFINTVNSWSLRPSAITEIENLFLASDYVKNNTDLATMEGANEAARRAVNGILADLEQKKGLKIDRCSIFDFDEPAVFAPFRAIDKWMHDRGLPRPGVLNGAFGLLSRSRFRVRDFLFKR